MPEVRAQIIVSAKDEASVNLKKVGDAGAKAGSELNKGLSGAIQSATGLNLASVGLAGAVVALGAGLAYSVKQAAEAERIFAITESVVKATGGAAGLTATQVADMADKLSVLNAVDDETILSAQNLLLTFKQIKGDAFEPATQAAIDLSTVMGGDLRGAAMMVGKALEDPVRGITALRRAGVSFTTEQQAMIKSLVETGKAAEAQELILTELNRQVGGAGVAAAKTYTGQLALLKINVDNLAETVGSALLPPLTKATEALNLLITANVKITDAFEEHRAEIEVSTLTYTEYKEELLRAAVASGKLSEATAQMIREHKEGDFETGTLRVADYTENIGLLTEAEREARREAALLAAATAEVAAVIPTFTNQLSSEVQWLEDTADAAGTLRDVTQEVSDKIDILKIRVGSAVDNELEAYNLKQADLRDRAEELKGKIEELNGKPFLTTAQREDLEDWQTELGDLQTEMADTAEEHARTTMKILFDMALLEAGRNGYTLAEEAWLTALAERWGLAGEATGLAIFGIGDALTALADDDIAGADEAMDGLLDKFGLLPPSGHSWRYDFFLNTYGTVPQGLPSGGPIGSPSPSPVPDDYSPQGSYDPPAPLPPHIPGPPPAPDFSIADTLNTLPGMIERAFTSALQRSGR